MKQGKPKKPRRALEGFQLAMKIGRGKAGGIPLQSLSAKARRQLTAQGHSHEHNAPMPTQGARERARRQRHMQRQGP